jgi:hypothetical protein
MIYAIVVFAATGLPPTVFRSAVDFATLAECEAQLAAEMPRLERARQMAQIEAGRPVRMVARCVEEGQGV